MTEERGHWYLLTGIVIGALLGLAIAWLVVPREYQDTSPASLRANFKDEYRALIAAAYVANGNLPRAKARLDLLRDRDPVRTLAEQAQRTLAEGRSPREAQALGLLAVALEQGSPPPFTVAPTAGLPSLVPTSISGTPSPETSLPPASPSPQATATSSPSAVPTATSVSTGEPLPTRTPTSTQQAPLVLQEKNFICDPSLAGPLLQVVVNNQDQPVPGVEATVRWEGGEDHFFTGMKPEIGLGYADYTMMPGVVYTLQLAGGGQPVPDLTPAECEAAGGSRYWGSWLLIFSQP